MATKADLETMRGVISQEAKLQISQVVDPLKDTLHDVQQRVTTMETNQASAPS